MSSSRPFYCDLGAFCPKFYRNERNRINHLQMEFHVDVVISSERNPG